MLVLVVVVLVVQVKTQSEFPHSLQMGALVSLLQ
jgi:hypothetical protein